MCKKNITFRILKEEILNHLYLAYTTFLNSIFPELKSISHKILFTNKHLLKFVNYILMNFEIFL